MSLTLQLTPKTAIEKVFSPKDTLVLALEPMQEVMATILWANDSLEIWVTDEGFVWAGTD